MAQSEESTPAVAAATPSPAPAAASAEPAGLCPVSETVDIIIKVTPKSMKWSHAIEAQVLETMKSLSIKPYAARIGSHDETAKGMCEAGWAGILFGTKSLLVYGVNRLSVVGASKTDVVENLDAFEIRFYDMDTKYQVLPFIQALMHNGHEVDDDARPRFMRTHITAIRSTLMGSAAEVKGRKLRERRAPAAAAAAAAPAAADVDAEAAAALKNLSEKAPGAAVDDGGGGGGTKRKSAATKKKPKSAVKQLKVKGKKKKVGKGKKAAAAAEEEEVDGPDSSGEGDAEDEGPKPKTQKTTAAADASTAPATETNAELQALDAEIEAHKAQMAAQEALRSTAAAAVPVTAT